MKKTSTKIFSQLVLFIIHFYRIYLSNYMGGNCRFEPSCSKYAEEAFCNFSSFKAIRLVLLRLFRCRPFGKYGFDPIPEKYSGEGK